MCIKKKQKKRSNKYKFMNVASTEQEPIPFGFQAIPFLLHALRFLALLWPFLEALVVGTFVFELGLNPTVLVIYFHAMTVSCLPVFVLMIEQEMPMRFCLKQVSMELEHSCRQLHRFQDRFYHQ